MMTECSRDPALLLTRNQVRRLDIIAEQDFGIDGLVLMENAGRGCAELLLRHAAPRRVVICCGKGNNGGDGFVIARHLEIAGVDVEVVLLAAPHEVLGDAAKNLRILLQSGTPIRVLDLPPALDEFREVLASADWIVDAMLGTGLTGAARDPYSAAIAEINAAGRSVLAVDLPSGLDGDTGQPLGPCIQAQLTATFVAKKPGFLNPSSARWLGSVEVIGIGIPRKVIERVLS